MCRDTRFTALFMQIVMVFCLLMATGCINERGEVGPKIPESLPKEQTRVTELVAKPRDKVAKLSQQLRERSDHEIQQLANLIAFQTVASERSSKPLKEPLQAIADELLLLTLKEADRLGTLLEGQENARRLPVLIADRQVQAREVVEKIQKRLKKGLNDSYSKGAFILEPLELPWLESETGRQYEQVTALSLECEHDDLGMTRTDVSDDDMFFVGMLTSLKYLGIRESQVTGKGLHALRSLQNLETLDARRINVAVGDWNSLQTLTGLRKLSLQPIEDDRVDIGWVGQLPNLEELLVYQADMNQIELAGLCRSQSLRTLDLLGETLQQTIVLQDLPKLIKLNLSVQVNGENTSARLKLANLKQLQNFNISVYRPWDDPGWATVEQFDLAELPKLKHVSLTVQQFTTSGLASLGKLPSLQVLWMQGMTIPGETFRSLEELDELVDLNCRTDDGNRALKSISQINSLKKLRLLAEEISDEGLKAVSGLSQLTFLNLGGVNASRVFSEEIMKLENLREFRVDGGVLPTINFVDHPTLKSLWFSQVQSEKVELKDLPQLRHFDFNEGEFSKITFYQLPKLYTCLLGTVRPEKVRSVDLIKVPQLHTFGLSSPRGTNKAPEMPISLGDDFIAQFRPLQRLHVLSLSNVLVTDEGLLKLGHLLHLGQRDINGPNITDEGHTQLRRAIEAQRIKTWGNKSP